MRGGGGSAAWLRGPASVSFDDDARRNGAAPPTPPPPRDVSTPEARAEFVAYWAAVKVQERAATEYDGLYPPMDPDDMTPGERAAEESGYRVGISAERRSWRRHGHGLDGSEDVAAEEAAGQYAESLAATVGALRLRRDATRLLAAEDTALSRVTRTLTRPSSSPRRTLTSVSSMAVAADDPRAFPPSCPVWSIRVTQPEDARRTWLPGQGGWDVGSHSQGKFRGLQHTGDDGTP